MIKKSDVYLLLCMLLCAFILIQARLIVIIFRFHFLCFFPVAHHRL